MSHDDVPLTPLTKEQSDFAALNHNLVYRFLNENHLAEDEYYDIVIFGYLRAVRRYFEEPELRQYSFSTTAMCSMRRALLNHQREQKQKRRVVADFTLHSEVTENAVPMGLCNTAHAELMREVETELILHALAAKVTEQQMAAVRMRASGYNLQEIARSQKTTANTVRLLLDEVYLVLTQLCRE